MWTLASNASRSLVRLLSVAYSRALLPAAVRYRGLGLADVAKGVHGWEVDKAAALLCCCAALEHRGGGDWRGKGTLIVVTVALEDWPEAAMPTAGRVAAALLRGSHDAAHAWRLVLGRLEGYAAARAHCVCALLRAALPLSAVLPLLVSRGALRHLFPSPLLEVHFFPSFSLSLSLSSLEEDPAPPPLASSVARSLAHCVFFSSRFALPDRCFW